MDIAAMSMQMSNAKASQQVGTAVMKLALDAVSGAQNNMLNELMGEEAFAMLNEALPVDNLASGGLVDMYI